jgi:Fe(3+) dicitrate transport protein
VGKDSDREVTYLPFFVENRFSWGRFSLTPGFRLENAWQGVRENLNREKSAEGVALLDASNRILVPLFGVGASYELARKVELYANVSQSYRPKVWTEAVPINPTAVMPRALDESLAWQYEIGLKGRPQTWLYWDVSAFLLDFDNQIGQVPTNLPGGGNGTSYQNVGRARHAGVEFSGELDLLGWFHSKNAAEHSSSNAPAHEDAASTNHSLSLYVNTTFLDAEFVSGPQKGYTPMYASRYMVRSGLVFRTPGARSKIALTSSFIGKAYGDDGNSAQRAIPSYAVWDITGETNVYKDFVSVNWGINNLFDKNYFSRVTDTGIDPAQGRNFYGGVSLKF